MSQFHCLQVRSVAVNSIVLGAGSKFDVFAQQIFDPAELIRRVVAGRTAVAVKVGTHPTLCVDNSPQLQLHIGDLSFRDLKTPAFAVVFRTSTEEDLVTPWIERAVQATVY